MGIVYPFHVKCTEELFNLVKDLWLPDKVSSIGYVEQDGMFKNYSCAEFFVFSSFYEGFCKYPLEAITCGTPIIVLNSASLPEVLADAGILVDLYNIDDIAYEMNI